MKSKIDLLSEMHKSLDEACGMVTTTIGFLPKCNMHYVYECSCDEETNTLNIALLGLTDEFKRYLDAASKCKQAQSFYGYEYGMALPFQDLLFEVESTYSKSLSSYSKVKYYIKKSFIDDFCRFCNLLNFSCLTSPLLCGDDSLRSSVRFHETFILFEYVNDDFYSKLSFVFDSRYNGVIGLFSEEVYTGTEHEPVLKVHAIGVTTLRGSDARNFIEEHSYLKCDKILSYKPSAVVKAVYPYESFIPEYWNSIVGDEAIYVYPVDSLSASNDCYEFYDVKDSHNESNVRLSDSFISAVNMITKTPKSKSGNDYILMTSRGVPLMEWDFVIKSWTLRLPAIPLLHNGTRCTSISSFTKRSLSLPKSTIGSIVFSDTSFNDVHHFDGAFIGLCVKRLVLPRSSFEITSCVGMFAGSDIGDIVCPTNTTFSTKLSHQGMLDGLYVGTSTISAKSIRFAPDILNTPLSGCPVNAYARSSVIYQTFDSSDVTFGGGDIIFPDDIRDIYRRTLMSGSLTISAAADRAVKNINFFVKHCMHKSNYSTSNIFGISEYYYALKYYLDTAHGKDVLLSLSKAITIAGMSSCCSERTVSNISNIDEYNELFNAVSYVSTGLLSVPSRFVTKPRVVSSSSYCTPNGLIVKVNVVSAETNTHVAYYVSYGDVADEYRPKPSELIVVVPKEMVADKNFIRDNTARCMCALNVVFSSFYSQILNKCSVMLNMLEDSQEKADVITNILLDCSATIMSELNIRRSQLELFCDSVSKSDYSDMFSFASSYDLNYAKKWLRSDFIQSVHSELSKCNYSYSYSKLPFMHLVLDNLYSKVIVPILWRHGSGLTGKQLCGVYRKPVLYSAVKII